ncbi:tol-pal system protein YbgF, partial [Pseudomonas aeruginosa MPAO1/P2]
RTGCPGLNGTAPAVDLIKSKDFDKASQAFNAFLRKYPNSQYSGNAELWCGGWRHGCLAAGRCAQRRVDYLALALMSGLEVDELVRCVQAQDTSTLVKIWGTPKQLE